MEYSDWQARWSEGRIGFHQAEGNARLKAHWQSFVDWCGPHHGKDGARVLVPLCGKTADLGFLSRLGHRVVGVEYVEAAARDYFSDLGVDANVAEQNGAPCYAFDQTQILVRDFFELEPGALGSIDLAYDRAALVAISPAKRAAYVRTLAHLIEPGGGLLLISFEHDFGSGPPFSVPEVPELFAREFAIEEREKRDILEEESRFRERGATYMHEVVWYARRRV